MASSTLLADLETGLVKARLRSLSLVSHPNSPIESPPVASPYIPATPVNTSATGSPAPPSSAASPFVLSPPANTPVDGLDSGQSTPTQRTAPIQLHPPDFIKIHHFHSPILWPTAPPNSPDTLRLTGSMDANMTATDETSIANIIQNLSRERKSEDEVDVSKYMVYGPARVPVAANDLYEIRYTPGRGYGCFATRNLPHGTRILADKLLLFVPVANYYESDINESFSKLTEEEKTLYFSLHSAHGQDPENWPPKIHPGVGKREKSRILEQHIARVSKEPSLISIFQTNCMELGSGAAIFPNAARFNHSCNPNACFVWNNAIQKETIHAMRDIEKDEEITLTYCDMMQDRKNRTWELKHYGFFCDCPACDGDLSDPTSFAAKSELNRHRLKEIAEEEIKRVKDSDDLGQVDKLLQMISLLREEGDYSSRLASLYVELALVCESQGKRSQAAQIVLIAFDIVVKAQGYDHPIIPEYESLIRKFGGVVPQRKDEAAV